MVQRDRRDDRQCRMRNNIGRVNAAAQSDFEEERVRGMLGEEQKRRRRRDLKKSDWLAAIGVLMFWLNTPAYNVTYVWFCLAVAAVLPAHLARQGRAAELAEGGTRA